MCEELSGARGPVVTDIYALDCCDKIQKTNNTQKAYGISSPRTHLTNIMTGCTENTRTRYTAYNNPFQQKITTQKIQTNFNQPVRPAEHWK